MAFNTLGYRLTLTTFGESHGEAIGGIVDGFPAGVQLDMDAVQHELNRRKPGQSALVTQRKEGDKVRFLSGIFEGVTTGSPIGFLIENENVRSTDYDHLKDAFRPSHADYTYQQKYGHRDYRGGGRSSARETANWVVAGALAKQVLQAMGCVVRAAVIQVGEVSVPELEQLNFDEVELNPVRCGHRATADQMEEYLKAIRKEGDTVGGMITCEIQNPPEGLGEPVFGKLHAELGKAMLSINAAKGFEYGSGFRGANMRGSTHNDKFVKDGAVVSTRTNFSGGIQGGISNGETIYFNVAFKPVATLMQSQETVNHAGEPVVIQGKGRHDPCVVPRAVPIVEALAAFVLLDFYLINRSTQLKD
jgi:chorismate synthase